MYAEGRANIWKIFWIFGPYLIRSDLWFHISKVHLPDKPTTPKEIVEDLKGTQRQLWKEALFVKYDKNKYFNLFLYPIPIKYLPNETRVLHSLIDTSIQEGKCFDAWKCVSRHCSNGSYYIQSFYFDQSYSTASHADSLIINIDIAAMHRITDRILDVSSLF